MSILGIQELQVDINKDRYKKLSRGSFHDLLNSQELSDSLPYCLEEIFKWDTEQIEVKSIIVGEDRIVNRTQVANMITGVWLNKEKSITLCKKNKDKSIDLITAFFDDFKYSDECLDVLDLLSKNGAAILYVPALEYKNLYKALSARNDLHINAIFGSHDDRDSTNTTDQKYILPENCKCLAVIITRKKNDLLYLWLEYSLFHGEIADDPKQDPGSWIANDLSNFFHNNLSLTSPVDVYKKIISANRVVVKPEEFVDVESFYTNKQIEQDQNWLTKFPKKKLFDICRNLTSDSIGIMHFLKCIDDDGYLDVDKWNIYAKENNKNEKYVEPTLEEKVGNLNKVIEVKRGYTDEQAKRFSLMHKLAAEEFKAKDYIPKLSVKNARQICIIETYDNEFDSSYFRFTHPYNWRMGEFKYGSVQSDSFSVSLVVFHPNELIDNYLFTFIESEAGLLSQKNALISSDDYSVAWKEIEVPLPSISQQEIIACTLNNANDLIDKVSALKDKLIVNPDKAKEINESLKVWLKRLDELSLDEKILGWIKGGESDSVEFKATFSLDIKKQTYLDGYAIKREDKIEHAVLKTIVGFLNSKGGTLLIGVSDDCTYSGVMTEVEKLHKNSLDKFLKHFKNILKRSIGAEYYPYFKYQLVKVNGSQILYVNCERSTKKPCFLDGKEFFVRTNPSTDKLEGSIAQEYINNNWD